MTTTTDDILSHVKLQFHVNNPNLEECWADGYALAQAGIVEEDNPYEEGSAEHEQWSQGWWAGFYEEAHLYEALEGKHLQLARIVQQTVQPAANEPRWLTPRVKKWATRTLQMTSAVVVLLMVMELTDLAV